MSSLKEASAVLDVHDTDSALQNDAALTTEPISFHGIDESIETFYKGVQGSATSGKETIYTSEKKQVDALQSEHVKDDPCGVDSATKSDIKDVKTPELFERVKEEVEAVTQTFQDKLDIKDDKFSESSQQEQPGYLSRIIRKVGSYFGSGGNDDN